MSDKVQEETTVGGPASASFELVRVRDLNLIRLHPRLKNVREDLPKILETVESIRRNGLIHPLTAMRGDGRGVSP